MGAPKLDIIRGQVVDVQLTERTIIEEPSVIRPNGRRARRGEGAPSGIITGRLRVFLDGPGLKDPHYDFENCELAVHKGQDVAIVRYQRRKKDGPRNVMLRNISAETECVFESGIEALVPRPWFGPRWKAFGLSLVMFAAGYLLSHYVISPERGQTWWIMWPLLFSVLAYPVFWGIMILVSRMSRSARKKRMIAYVRERAQQAAPSLPPAPTAAPAEQPQQAQAQAAQLAAAAEQPQPAEAAEQPQQAEAAQPDAPQQQAEAPPARPDAPEAR